MQLASALLPPRKADREVFMRTKLRLRDTLPCAENRWTKNIAFEVLMAVCDVLPGLARIPRDLRTRVRGMRGSMDMVSDDDGEHGSTAAPLPAATSPSVVTATSGSRAPAAAPCRVSVPTAVTVEHVVYDGGCGA